MLIIYNLLFYCIMGGWGWGRQSKVFKLILKFLSKNRWCWVHSCMLTSRRRRMWQCVCNSPFTETQNYDLLRHRTSFSDHQKINNVTKFVTTSGNTCRSWLSWFSARKTVKFEVQNSFLAVFWRRGKFETTEQTSINAWWSPKAPTLADVCSLVSLSKKPHSNVPFSILKCKPVV